MAIILIESVVVHLRAISITWAFSRAQLAVKQLESSGVVHVLLLIENLVEVIRVFF